MSTFTIADLARLLKECAGEEESNLRDDALEVPFAAMGYDSVAMLEIAGRLRAEYGVVMDDEEILPAETPRQLLDLVNTSMAVDR
ncbi:acyl carrier protein [Micromonospora sp. DT229]|uniref:acyl carrier protein n=1 Tax=Micromonospora sp. DT229 TaxID=3393430 RepID=UPI003CFA6ACC